MYGLFNINVERDAEITVRIGIIVRIFENVYQIILGDEIERALKKLNTGKTAGLVKVSTKCLRLRGNTLQCSPSMHLTFATKSSGDLELNAFLTPFK